MTLTEGPLRRWNRLPKRAPGAGRILWLLLVPLAGGVQAQDPKPSPEAPRYSQIHEIFARHCVSCHNAKDKKGELTLETFEGLKKGGETGAALVAGKSAESPLVAQIEHRAKPFMPPPKKGEKLKPEEIALVRRWIDSGAPAPRPGELAQAVSVPVIVPKVTPRRPVLALAYEPHSKLVAFARPGAVELRSAEHQGLVRRLGEGHGNVQAVAFSADGATLALGLGEPGASGGVLLFDLPGGTLRSVLKGHRDLVYALSLSSDGKMLATASYDQKILLWDLASGRPLRELAGHNEAVFDVAFRPDGKILASASADRTVKLWDVATGERRETLSDPTKAVHSLSWSPDGQRLAAGGVDNRIRVWKISPDAKEGTNPLLYSVFAHEGAILRVVYSRDGKRILSSADDRSVKLWNAVDVSSRLVLPPQPDWPAALGFALEDKTIVVGRLDGSVAFYDAASGQPIQVPKPELSGAWPRGLRRGEATRVQLQGKNLGALTGLKFSAAAFEGRLEADSSRPEVAWAQISPPAEASAGPVELWVENPGGESGRIKLYVDSLPQVMAGLEPTTSPLPAHVWGVLDTKGEADHFAFEAKRGQTIVIDAAARRLGSKAELVLTLTDQGGKVLASSLEFDGEVDPLLALSVPADGRYLVRVSDLELGASNDHYYRLLVGEIPLVTACYPLAIAAHRETSVDLVGFNLPPGASVRVKAEGPGEMALPIDPGRFRARREIKVLVGNEGDVLEVEPNDRPERATPIPAPGSASGRIGSPGDVDLYRFESKAGQSWIVETQAAQRGSPVDTRLEVLHADGRPVERILLRAVRDSYITFRPIDSNANGARLEHWEEMDQNQYLYMQGEVVRLFLPPRGPDSQWDFYTLGGRRICYFDTSPTAHALDERCFIVEPHPPGTKLPPNGLPTFTLPYANDDESHRKMGSDSRIHFVAPAAGSYLVRVRDVRGLGGDRFVYRLVLREAKPDFAVSIEGASPAVPTGAGMMFTLRLDRKDGFEGPVQVDLSGIPPGFEASTPLVIEAGHFEAKGTLFAQPGAQLPPAPAPALTLKASASPAGRPETREVGTLGAPRLTPKPKIRVYLEPVPGGEAPVDPGAPSRILVVPGKTVPALLRIEREGLPDRVTFDVENLPFGVIVADIGLNGVLIPEGQTERRIFLSCASWVAPADRVVFARAREAGNPTSHPVALRVVGAK